MGSKTRPEVVSCEQVPNGRDREGTGMKQEGGSDRDLQVQPLDRIPIGEKVQVVGLAAGHPDRLIRLSGLGIVPGATLHVRQRRPATVLSIGATTLALDPEITAGIVVRR